MTRFLGGPASGPIELAEPPQVLDHHPRLSNRRTRSHEAVASALDQTYSGEGGNRLATTARAMTPPPRWRLSWTGSSSSARRTRGPRRARNAAIARASGDFVVNLDADDLLDAGNLGRPRRATATAPRPRHRHHQRPRHGQRHPGESVLPARLGIRDRGPARRDPEALLLHFLGRPPQPHRRGRRFRQQRQPRRGLGFFGSG